MFRKGDFVTRNKYNNDILFKIDRIEKNIVFLKGVDIRLYADCDIDDLKKSIRIKKKKTINKIRKIDNSKYFFIPGIILHIDSDSDYIERCVEYYKEQKLKVFTFFDEEKNYEKNIDSLIKKYNPNIIVITGHDAYYKNSKNGKHYKNSEYFINTVNRIKNNDKNIIIFAGACQSDYESLIRSGATFASSPERINIHALDPAIVASYIACTNINETIDMEDLLSKTHYKEAGIGGLIIKGKMYCGYPRGNNN